MISTGMLRASGTCCTRLSRISQLGSTKTRRTSGCKYLCSSVWVFLGVEASGQVSACALVRGPDSAQVLPIRARAGAQGPRDLPARRRRLSRRRADHQSHRLSRSEEHTSELQSPCNLVCRLLLEKKKKVPTFMNVLK